MNTLDLVYQDLLQAIMDHGVTKQTRNGETKSVFGYQIRHDMQSGFPLLTTKKMAWKQIVTELLWFLRGDTNIKYLVDNDCHIWDGDAYKNYFHKTSSIATGLTQEAFINRVKTDDEFAKKWGDLGPVYGKQWRSWKLFKYEKHTGHLYSDADLNGKKLNLDQIANLIRDLKTNPDSRRLMVSAWNVGELDQMVLPPCHYGFQVYTRELSLEERRELVTQEMFNQIYNGGSPESLSHKEINQWNIPTRAISLMWNQRSVDVPLGLPFNIASYGLLLEIIAKMVNMVPDQLIGNLGDCHIYSNQMDGCKEQLTRTPFELPTLNINTEWWPTESGECGEGPIDAMAVVNGFSDDNFCKCLLEEDIQLGNYQSHPKIAMPLSN